MAKLWEELYLLDTLVMSDPCVKPLLWNEACMFLLSEVRGSIYQPLATAISSYTVIYSSSLMNLFSRISSTFVLLLVFFESLLSHLFESLHYLFLVLIQICCLLTLEMLHSFVKSPWTLKFSSCGVTCLLSRTFKFLS